MTDKATAAARRSIAGWIGKRSMPRTITAMRSPTARNGLQGWRETSAAVRGETGARLDLPYGPRPRQRLDFFPTAAERAAVRVHPRRLLAAQREGDLRVRCGGTARARHQCRSPRLHARSGGELDRYRCGNPPALDFLVEHAARTRFRSLLGSSLAAGRRAGI